MALSMAKTTIVIKDTTTTLFVSNLFFITLVGGAYFSTRFIEHLSFVSAQLGCNCSRGRPTLAASLATSANIDWIGTPYRRRARTIRVWDGIDGGIQRSCAVTGDSDTTLPCMFLGLRSSGPHDLRYAITNNFHHDISVTYAITIIFPNGGVTTWMLVYSLIVGNRSIVWFLR